MRAYVVNFISHYCCTNIVNFIFFCSVLVRCDLDLSTKIDPVDVEVYLNRSLPTIRHLINQGAKIVLCGHHGAPTALGPDSTAMAPSFACIAV